MLVPTRCIFQQGKPLDTVSIRTGLAGLLSWLEQFDHPVLVAHNCWNFDSTRLTVAYDKLGLLPRFVKT